MATQVQNPFDTQPPAATNTNPTSPTPAGTGAVSGGTTQPMNTGLVNQAVRQNNPTPDLKPQTYTAQNREVNAPTETAAGQVDSILAKDSPLMQRARTMATQQMAQRGLINTSMAQGAGVAAMIDRATPIAQQDAQTFSNRTLANMEATNQQNQFNTGQQNQLFQQGQDIGARFGMQKDAQQYQTGEAALDRSQQTSLQALQQNFQGAQSALQRAQEVALADKSIDAQQALQKAQQDFQGAQSALQRSQEVALADKSIGAQQALQKGQQDFQGAQAGLDRSQQTLLQKDAQIFQTGERVSNQSFQAGQNKIQNDFNLSLQKLQESGMDFRQARDIASREALTQLEQAGVTNRFDRELALKGSMFNVEQLNAQKRQIDQNDFELKRLGVQLNAQRQDIPTAFAATISNTAMTGVNGILADANLTADAKKAAINNLVGYANSQITWASKFYGASIPALTVPT